MSGTTPIENINMRYYALGTSIPYDTTDVLGATSVELFPGTYPFRATSPQSKTTVNMSINVSGDGATAGATTTETAQFTRVEFQNSGSVRYTSLGTNVLITGSAFYMAPGTYSMRFNNIYHRDVDISGVDFVKVASVIVLKDHNGDNMAQDTYIGAARGGITTLNFYVYATDNATNFSDGSVRINLTNPNTNTNRTYEVTYSKTKRVITQDVTTNNVFEFQTNQLVAQLTKCDGTPISGATLRYGIGTSINAHWGASTDASGMVTKEFFTDNDVLVEMKTKLSTQEKTINFTGNDTIKFNTTLFKLNYPVGYNVVYGKTIANSWFEPIGPKEAELLPGDLIFNIKAGGTDNIVTITIPESTPGSCADYAITPVMARLINSSGAPMAGGVVKYYEAGTWKTLAETTAANGYAMVLLEGYKTKAQAVRMIHNGSTKILYNTTLAPVNNILDFQTTNITITLNNTTLEGNTVKYYAGGAWRQFDGGVTVGQTAQEELLIGSGAVSFTMKLNHTRQQINVSSTALSSNPNVDFTAKQLQVHFIDEDCDNGANTQVRYYAGGWHSLGYTDANGLTTPIDVLPTANNIHFSAHGYAVDATEKINTDALQTIEVIDCNLPVFASSATAPSGLLDIADKFSFYPNPVTTTLNFEVVNDNTEVSFYSIDGRMIHNQTYGVGTYQFDATSLASGMYLINVRNGNESESYKFMKK